MITTSCDCPSLRRLRRTRVTRCQQALLQFDQKNAGRPRIAGRHPSHRANGRALAAVTREGCHEAHAISACRQSGLYCCRIGRLSPSHSLAAAARAGAPVDRRWRATTSSRSLDSAGKAGKRTPGPAASRSRPPRGPESATGKRPHLRLRRRRLRASRRTENQIAGRFVPAAPAATAPRQAPAPGRRRFCRA